MADNGKTIMVFLTVVTLVLSPIAGAAYTGRGLDQDEPEAGEMVLDLVVVRPLGFASMILGTAAFVVSFPFTAISGSVDSAYRQLMKKPAEFTFKRRLGEI